jgi:hypothetical protein
MSRNEYNNISIDRASRILDALGVRMRSAFERLLTNRTAAQRDRFPSTPHLRFCIFWRFRPKRSASIEALNN